MPRVNHPRRKASGLQPVGPIAQRIRDNLAFLRFIERATRPVAVQPEPEPESRR